VAYKAASEERATPNATTPKTRVTAAPAQDQILRPDGATLSPAWGVLGACVGGAITGVAATFIGALVTAALSGGTLAVPAAGAIIGAAVTGCVVGVIGFDVALVMGWVGGLFG
jgi:1-aminocyclopropane-1-carboxylate deaminase/D-cysteine desulfhydrase-like pyridoxal-dependent ACC family enzyme